MASYHDYVNQKAARPSRSAKTGANRMRDLKERFQKNADRSFDKIVNKLFPEGIAKQQQSQKTDKISYKVPKTPVFNAKNVLAGVVRFLDTQDRQTLDRLAQKTRDATVGERLGAYRQLNSYLDKRRVVMEGLAKKLQSGKIGVDEFQLAMQREIRRVHLAASVIGTGGALNMTDERMRLLNEAIEKQMQYLDRFTNDLREKAKRGEPMSPKDIRRAGMYADSARSTAEQSLRSFISEEFGDLSEESRELGVAEHCDGCVEEAAKGWQPIGTLKPIGSLECGNHCHCKFVFRIRNTKQEL